MELSKYGSLNKNDFKSAAKDAAAYTIGYFGLTIPFVFEKIMDFQWTYLLSIVIFYALAFSYKLAKRYFQDGEQLEKEIISKYLDDQKDTENDV